MTSSLDDRARRLVAAVGEAAERDARVPPPSPRVLADLYLHVRERLAELGARTSVDLAAEDLALTIYLAWLADEGAPGPGDLASLKACLERALRATSQGA